MIVLPGSRNNAYALTRNSQSARLIPILARIVRVFAAMVTEGEAHAAAAAATSSTTHLPETTQQLPSTCDLKKWVETIEGSTETQRLLGVQASEQMTTVMQQLESITKS